MFDLISFEVGAAFAATYTPMTGVKAELCESCVTARIFGVMTDPGYTNGQTVIS
jgi:hypothetical protein